MESYITRSNALKIIAKSNFNDIEFSGQVYKYKLYLFGKHEENGLLAIQELFKNPEHYFTEIYRPIIVVDSKKYVFKEQKPCYHSFDDCERLHSDYSNFELPEEIKARGDVEIERFRLWFIENIELLKNNPVAFVFRLEMAFKIKYNPKAVNFENGGFVEIQDYSLLQLEEKIDMLVKSAGRYYYQNEKNKIILKQFGGISGISFSDNQLYNNNTGYSDFEVKSFLKTYHIDFKLPLKRLLIEYYRIKLNPDLKIKSNLLEALGFRKCGACKKVELEMSNQ